MILEEIKQIKRTNKDILNFALLIGGIIAFIGFITIFYDSNAFTYLIPFGFIFILLGFITPIILKPIYLFWMILSVVLGFISTRLILGILFYLIITPISLVFKISGKDLLNTKLDKKVESYWVKRENIKYGKEETERQF
ncbi:MAG TPA: SxtJ family membrane protein [Melioribacteraceae bacterium]|nr:SxtJ family membrane protein [Melioribacteraceae bacterium]